MPSSSSTTNYGFSPHPSIIQLAQNKFHIPITQKLTYKHQLSQFQSDSQMDKEAGTGPGTIM
jgi:hypothetical protein